VKRNEGGPETKLETQPQARQRPGGAGTFVGLVVTAGVVRAGRSRWVVPGGAVPGRVGWLVGMVSGLLVGGASGKLGVGGESDHVVGLRV
jgi:hypothetical protein